MPNDSTMKYDFIIIGSGFGGSVAAMRLSEKGYKVLVLEKGKAYSAPDFPKSSWRIKKFLWYPLLRCFGILKLSFFNRALVLSGVGVGGGSLVYGNVHMKPPRHFYTSGPWAGLADWEEVLAPHYRNASFMLGSSRVPTQYAEDEVLQSIAAERGNPQDFKSVDAVGIYFGNKDNPTDPYFGGLGPKRTGCRECAGCMIGCQHNAKNTLDKNYLYFAKKFGAVIKALTEVRKITHEKDNGYTIEAIERKGLFNKKRIKYHCTNLVVSGGVLGTLKLLFRQKYHYKTLPDLSAALGENLRTNSESICGIADADRKLNNGIAISSMYKVNDHTTVEICKFPNGSGTLGRLAVLATPDAKFPLRIVKWLAITVRHPVRFVKYYFSKNFASRSVYILVMQALDNSMKMAWRKGWRGNKMKMTSGNGSKPPAFIPEGQEIMNRYAEKVKGTAINSMFEVFFNMSTTAHILGGCPMGANREEGVVGSDFQVHGYPGMFILDASIIQSNPGVNPSLSIAALSEYACSLIATNSISPEKSPNKPLFQQLQARSVRVPA